jgi:hypothetical protein
LTNALKKDKLLVSLEIIEGMDEINFEGELQEHRPRLESERVEIYSSEFSNVGELKSVEYSTENAIVAYLESEMLEGLVGFADAEALSELDRYYPTSFTSIEFDSFAYGNGWALIKREE